jgi:excisionase family DNA binding protein
VRDELQFALRAARDLPAEELPRLLGEIEEVRCTAMARLATPAPVQSAGSDELLSVEEASRRLGVSKDYLYRHGSEFPFTRRMGRKLLFSSLGIEKHIKQQDVLTARRHSGTLMPTVNRTAKGNR